MRYYSDPGTLAGLIERGVTPFLRQEPNTAATALERLARSSDHNLRAIAQGIQWADESCRIGGTLSLAIRRASGVAVAELVALLDQDEINVMGDVPRWLNAHQEQALAVLQA